MMNEEVQNQLKQIFNDMKNDVTMVLFTQEGRAF